MKRIHICLLITAVLFSCTSPEKLLRRGDYDGLINKSIKKIIKNPRRQEDVELLDKAYKLANERDLDRIRYLKLEGNPDSWDEVLMHYSRLKDRQTRVRRVLPLNLHGRTINYEFIDYDAQMVEAKRNAAEYFYKHGKALMENKTKESYRQAFVELSKARGYSGGAFPDLDQMIDEAKYLGMNRILVSVINSTNLRLPEDFMENLLAINTYGLNTEWVEYHFKPLDQETAFDYYIDVNLQFIVVSPERINENDRLVKKKVQDGFEYVLDDRGNVMKDTAGNDIKVPRYKELTCTVIEKVKHKTVTLKGEIEVISDNPKRLISKDPISATTEFHHKSARAVGDIEALDEETKKAVGVKEIPFPDDITMIYDTSEALKQAITDVIRSKRRYIQ
ncbi:MAG: hypothetical protein JW723_13005 [Bacteroidales bacterium]|nr:hypothetical protein [Bacteroidales bacterium]